jgi:hypothetical protein
MYYSAIVFPDALRQKCKNKRKKDDREEHKPHEQTVSAQY